MNRDRTLSEKQEWCCAVMSVLALRNFLVILLVSFHFSFRSGALPPASRIDFRNPESFRSRAVSVVQRQGNRVAWDKKRTLNPSGSATTRRKILVGGVMWNRIHLVFSYTETVPHFVYRSMSIPIITLMKLFPSLIPSPSSFAPSLTLAT